VKLVLVEDGEVSSARVQENSFDPVAVSRELLAGVQHDRIIATGYGRHLFQAEFGGGIISEIKAFAAGARALFPACRTLLDIGGQDTKAISLDASGRVRKFEMNDRCAAGTGRFLEIMASALGFSLDTFGEAALTSGRTVKVNNMCTVFAESEVISLVARGMPREAVARGIHEAVVRRSAAMLRRIRIEGDLVFVGGVALNSCMRERLQAETGREVRTPGNPQIVGALGCALLAENSGAG